MNSPSANPDDGIEDIVRMLSSGCRQWIRRHAAYLDSPAGRAELPLTPRVKALLQLALLRRCWAKTDPGDPGLADITAVLEQAYRNPDFPYPDALDPRYAQALRLMYVALAPEGVAVGPPDTRFLMERPESPYLHLETRFFADMAGLGHRLSSYQDLYAASVLAGADETPAAELDSCNITHTVLYLSEFGLRETGLAESDRERAARVLERLTEHCVRQGDWDSIGKLLLAQHSLGLDPLRTASGTAGLRMLAEVQTPEGAIPGKTAAQRATPESTPERFFRLSYQTTLVTAMALVVLTPILEEAR
ncbi:MAG TPA: hypothetical protein VFN97_17190 [Actinospica sp.]|nr:hypothetical protein [Actinospica sp.]